MPAHTKYGRTLHPKSLPAVFIPRGHAPQRAGHLVIAIGSYLIHLLLILLNGQGLIQLESSFFQNPIAAIYTPFSFILVFEVYLLIYYLPKSISVYIGKQYEIITLIVIRRILRTSPIWNLPPIGFAPKAICNSPTMSALPSFCLFSSSSFTAVSVAAKHPLKNRLGTKLEPDVSFS